MHDLALLGDLLILVAFAIPTVALAERLGVPSIVAFLAAGLVIGPHGLGLIGQTDEVAALAELGAVLLLFEIGLEQSLARLVRMRFAAVVGGALQVTLTIAAVTVVGVLFGVRTESAAAFGCLIALSSTAIVLKGYRDRGELDTPYGRVALGILIFQDLAVVPLIVVLPLLAHTGGDAAGIVVRIVTSAGGLVVLAVGGRFFVPWVLERVVGLRSRELFTLTIAFFGLGAAFVSASVGLSLALGAFIAGLLISESDYGAQALSDVLPFRVLFSGIFFTSVGMLLDLAFVADHPALVLGIAAAVIAGKWVIVTLVTAWVLRRSFFISAVTGLGLAQVGEFSFVLAGVADGVGLLSVSMYQAFLAATVLSMLAAPFLQQHARTIVERLTGRLTDTAAARELPHAPRAAALEDHAIIVGYGMAGEHLARLLTAAQLPYVVLEVNGQTVRRARQERRPIFFGDGTRREVLERAGVRRARVLIFSISSPLDERRGVSIARELNPALKIIVRTRTVAAIPDLEHRGADEVVVEEYEAVVELFQRIMQNYRIPANTIAAELGAIRQQHYGALRSEARSALRLDDLRQLGLQHVLETVQIEEGAAAVDATLAGLRLRSRTGATVIAVIRDGVAYYELESFCFRAGDVAVLVGVGTALARAAELFRAPAERRHDDRRGA